MIPVGGVPRKPLSPAKADPKLLARAPVLRPDDPLDSAIEKEYLELAPFCRQVPQRRPGGGWSGGRRSPDTGTRPEHPEGAPEHGGGRERHRHPCWNAEVIVHERGGAKSIARSGEEIEARAVGRLDPGHAPPLEPNPRLPKLPGENHPVRMIKGRSLKRLALNLTRIHHRFGRGGS